MINSSIIDIRTLKWTRKKFTKNKSTISARRCPKYSAWRKQVFSRDRYTCQACGIRGVRINAHHIRSFKVYKALRYKVSNGFTMCSRCHTNFHKVYGKRNFPDVRTVLGTF